MSINRECSESQVHRVRVFNHSITTNNNGPIYRVQRAYDDKHTCHIKVINSSARRIGYGIKTTNMKRLGVDPPRGVLDPKEAVSPSSGPTLRMEPPSSSVASGSSETH
uniref:MSP domain-containing protein n=1 Tax=Caenorhabditis japonica TaxID=281687 RepID=A0A8R1E8R5_CAEJA